MSPCLFIREKELLPVFNIKCPYMRNRFEINEGIENIRKMLPIGYANYESKSRTFSFSISFSVMNNGIFFCV